MIRLILLLAAVLVIVIVLQQLKKTPKAEVKQKYWKLGLTALAIGLFVLAVTGRIHWLGAIFGALLPLLRITLPLLMRFSPKLKQYFFKNRTTESHTEITTPLLKIIINNDNQQLLGEVIAGHFSGQALDALSLAQLHLLLNDCQQQDQDGYALLMRYLNQRFDNNWQQSQQANNQSELSITEAYQVLGLAPGASKESIHCAHKKLIQKLHPDRGGNDYLAAKINRAKDILLTQAS